MKLNLLQKIRIKYPKAANVTLFKTVLKCIKHEVQVIFGEQTDIWAGLQAGTLTVFVVYSLVVA